MVPGYQIENKWQPSPSLAPCGGITECIMVSMPVYLSAQLLVPHVDRGDPGEECLVGHVYDQSGCPHPEVHIISYVRCAKRVVL